MNNENAGIRRKPAHIRTFLRLRHKERAATAASSGRNDMSMPRP